MAQVLRKAQPDCLRYFLMVLCGPENDKNETSSQGREESCTIDHLVSVLVSKAGYTTALAKETVANALSDGLLMPIYEARPQNTSAEKKRYRLPNSMEVRVSSSHDWYCYECHLPGMLEQCSQCWRSFHSTCYRKNPERPNYIVPSSKIQKNRLPVYGSDIESENDVDNIHNSTPMDYESDVVSTPLSQPAVTPQHEAASGEGDINSCFAQIEPKPQIEDLESKTTVDIVCLGQTRPPDRKRPNTTASSVSYKSELSQPDEEDIDIELCTCCRLMKKANLYNPPNLQADEISHLVGSTFSYNREWLNQDVRSYLESNRISANDIELVNHLLLYSPIKRLADIEWKLQRQQYHLLMEFLVDLMDIQHVIGLFFGPYSTELESTKWLLRDVAHDLSEIRRCPDCFRYSHEKGSIVWFAKPCVQRHELVYAKHSGFPYWPAKVIRVLPNHKHDVRFFGGNHSRALLDAKFIKSIDSDPKYLKLGNSSSFKKAMEELRIHQMLSTYPPSAFGFHANPQETENIIRTVLGTNITMINAKQTRRKGKQVMKGYPSNMTDQTSSIGDASVSSPRSSQVSNVCRELTVSLRRLKTHQIETASISSSEFHKSQRSKRTSKHHTEFEKGARETLVEMQKELDRKEKAIHKLTLMCQKEKIGKLKAIEKYNKLKSGEGIIKRKQWCYWCLKEAIYLCCFRAAYCSQMCQGRHWKDSHNKDCKNPLNDSKS